MSWLDDLLPKLHNTDLQIINDAKSPSGRPHVGSLRGILVHDAPFRFLQEKGINVKYIFGSDDYDPLDELPFGYGQEFEKYLGQPLCNVPPPPGSTATDLANYFISDFFKLFDEIGVSAEKYYMRDVYRSGKFDEAIDKILSNVEKVRKIYFDVSKSVRAADWYPYQVICEKCGRIGTTEVTGYDGKEVIYTCKPDKVSWAKGCGYHGKMSPFSGNGKLPYKVEWTAKWAYMNITIEGGGTDHNTKGGSRDVASAVLKELFGKRPPVNIPYGFFTLGGAKMSSSKGIGATARDMYNFLPVEILRFLMLGTQPKSQVNFEPTEKYIIKLFNDYDKLHAKYYRSEDATDYEKMVYRLSQVFHNEDYFTVDFTLIVTLLQLPHIDTFKEAEKRKGSPLTAYEIENLKRRIAAAQYWLDHYATPEEHIELQMTLPQCVANFTTLQKASMNNLATYLDKTDWSDSAIQTALFDAARTTPIDQKECFLSFYRLFLDKDQGPKAGNLLSCLEKDFVINRLKEVSFDRSEFWILANISKAEFEEWVVKERTNIVKVDATISFENGKGVIELVPHMSDHKIYMKRLLLIENEQEAFVKRAKLYIEQLNQEFGFSISI